MLFKLTFGTLAGKGGYLFSVGDLGKTTELPLSKTQGFSGNPEEVK